MRTGRTLLTLSAAAWAVLAAGSASAGTGENSFVPDSILVPIWGVSLFDSSRSTEAPLYKCPGPTDADCRVDLLDGPALDALFKARAAVPDGSYDQVIVRRCSTGTGYNAILRGRVLLSGTTYFTSAGTDPLSASNRKPGPVSVAFNGCASAYRLPSPLVVSKAGPAQLGIYFAAYDAAWAALEPRPFPDGCVQDPGGTHSVCLARPDLLPAAGPAAPALERYFIIETDHPTGAAAEVLLFADSNTGGLLGGLTRRIFYRGSVPASAAFDTALRTLRKNGDGSWFLESYGAYEGDAGFVRFPAFRRTDHYGTYLDQEGSTAPYFAYRDFQAGLPACPAGALLSRLPVARSGFKGLAPLGAFNPAAGRTFPSDRQYFSLNHVLPGDAAAGSVASPASAPADGWVTDIGIVDTVTRAGTLREYSLDFCPCREFSVHWDRLTGLSQPLAAAVTAWGRPDPATCRTERPSPGTARTTCTLPAMIRVKAGTPVARVGGGQAWEFGWGARDARAAPLAYADPARYFSAPNGMDAFHVVCGFDYYPASLRRKIDSFYSDGYGNRRTAQPLCGTPMQDLPGTAQGNWFRPGAPAKPEYPHLALAHGNVRPALGVFSIGGSLATLSSGTYYFTPDSDPASRVNRDFGLVSDSRIYCYDHLLLGADSAAPPASDIAILLQLAGPTTLRVQGVPAAGSDCAILGSPDDWSLSRYTEFDR